MENDMTNDSNPALLDMYLESLFLQESTKNYNAVHKPSVITDINTGKKIRVQALGGYGILDINFPVWAKQAGLEDFSMSDNDWEDPKVQDAIAKYKVQEYFNKYNSWDAVSVAWFAGPGKADTLVKDGTINYEEADNNGVTIKEYVAKMNNNLSEELMNIELPMQTFTPPQMISGPQTNPVVDNQRNMQQVFAAQILDAMTKANGSGMRPSFESQVPAEAGDFADKVAETQVRRGDIQ
tara:strand:+ start:6052 stop:6765 length:714 start_codon:yes stop_codon:yes gene_type:complete